MTAHWLPEEIVYIYFYSIFLRELGVFLSELKCGPQSFQLSQQSESISINCCFTSEIQLEGDRN